MESSTCLLCQSLNFSTFFKFNFVVGTTKYFPNSVVFADPPAATCHPIRMLGHLGVFSSPKDYRGQNYSALRKEAQNSGSLFVDPLFPANDKALSPTPGKFPNIQWKRPKVRNFNIICRSFYNILQTHGMTLF